MIPPSIDVLVIIPNAQSYLEEYVWGIPI